MSFVCQHFHLIIIFFLQNHKNPNEKKSDELYEIPVGATTKDLPPGVLYKVRHMQCLCIDFVSLIKFVDAG